MTKVKMQHSQTVTLFSSLDNVVMVSNIILIRDNEVSKVIILLAHLCLTQKTHM